MIVIAPGAERVSGAESQFPPEAVLTAIDNGAGVPLVETLMVVVTGVTDPGIAPSGARPPVAMYAVGPTCMVTGTTTSWTKAAEARRNDAFDGHDTRVRTAAESRDVSGVRIQAPMAPEPCVGETDTQGTDETTVNGKPPSM